jgi:hypothetical protein
MPNLIRMMAKFHSYKSHGLSYAYIAQWADKYCIPLQRRGSINIRGGLESVNSSCFKI